MTIFSTGRIAAAALLIAGLATTALADSKVRGQVTDSAGHPVAGAKVTFKDVSSGRSFKVKTNDEGEFYRRGVLPSTYLMTVEKPGFTEHIVEDVRVQAGVERHFDIALRTIEERQQEARAQRIAEGDSYLEGYDAFESGDYEKAVASADEAIAAKPDDPRGYDMKAKALISMRRYAEAIPLLEKELTMEGHAEDAAAVLAGTVYNAGALASQDGDTDAALRCWLRADELGYKEDKLAKLIGQAYLQKAEFAAARRFLQDYVDAHPDAADVAEVNVLLAELAKLEQAK